MGFVRRHEYDFHLLALQTPRGAFRIRARLSVHHGSSRPPQHHKEPPPIRRAYSFSARMPLAAFVRVRSTSCWFHHACAREPCVSACPAGSEGPQPVSQTAQPQTRSAAPFLTHRSDSGRDVSCAHATSADLHWCRRDGVGCTPGPGRLC